MASSLNDINQGFHRSYDRACEKAEDAAPVFVVLSDTLVLFHHGKEQSWPITPRSSTVIKSIAHAPVALFIMLQGDPQREEHSAAVQAFYEKLSAARQMMESDEASNGLNPAALAELRNVIDASMTFAKRALAKEALTTDDSDAFAQAMGPLLLTLTAFATEVELDLLDLQVNRALALLTPEEAKKLHVVVTGDHQARVRSLGMQYFRKRLGEDEEGDEDRVAYAEGVTEAAEAHALVGKRRFDTVIASAFFADKKRLQQDVLGDAVESLLAKRDLNPIGK